MATRSKSPSSGTSSAAAAIHRMLVTPRRCASRLPNSIDSASWSTAHTSATSAAMRTRPARCHRRGRAAWRCGQVGREPGRRPATPADTAAGTVVVLELFLEQVPAVRVRRALHDRVRRTADPLARANAGLRRVSVGLGANLAGSREDVLRREVAMSSASAGRRRARRVHHPVAEERGVRSAWPRHRRGSSAGQVAGHAIGVAVRRYGCDDRARVPVRMQLADQGRHPGGMRRSHRRAADPHVAVAPSTRPRPVRQRQRLPRCRSRRCSTIRPGSGRTSCRASAPHRRRARPRRPGRRRSSSWPACSTRSPTR